MFFQFLPGGGDSALSWVFSIVLFMVFFMFYPRIMLGQIMWKLEKTAQDLEDMSEKGKRFLIKEAGNSYPKKVEEIANRFFEFFMVSPVDLDPYGIVRKLDHAVRGQKERFHQLVREIAPGKSQEEQVNLEMGFAGGITVHQIAKIVRHYVEIARKTKSFQIAMILQMQMPLIERIARSMYAGTKAMARGEPIGDGLGPLVAATYIGNRKPKAVAEDIVLATVPMAGRTVFVLKAKGPGGRLGDPGKAVTTLMKQHRIAKIITVDAAAKLEGEATGGVAEGIGVAMGGIGVERYYIEQTAVEQNVPIDSIVVKMSQEQAITPMRKVIKDAVPGVMAAVERSVQAVPKGQKIVLVGVGNTSGVGNSGAAAKQVAAWVDKHEQKFARKRKRRTDDLDAELEGAEG